MCFPRSKIVYLDPTAHIFENAAGSGRAPAVNPALIVLAGELPCPLKQYLDGLKAELDPDGHNEYLHDAPYRDGPQPAY
jgi:hypothetical protein